jgi:hypothetical protein
MPDSASCVRPGARLQQAPVSDPIALHHRNGRRASEPGEIRPPAGDRCSESGSCRPVSAMRTSTRPNRRPPWDHPPKPGLPHRNQMREQRRRFGERLDRRPHVTPVIENVQSGQPARRRPHLLARVKPRMCFQYNRIRPVLSGIPPSDSWRSDSSGSRMPMTSEEPGVRSRVSTTHSPAAPRWPDGCRRRDVRNPAPAERDDIGRMRVGLSAEPATSRRHRITQAAAGRGTVEWTARYLFARTPCRQRRRQRHRLDGARIAQQVDRFDFPRWAGGPGTARELFAVSAPAAARTQAAQASASRCA